MAALPPQENVTGLGLTSGTHGEPDLPSHPVKHGGSHVTQPFQHSTRHVTTTAVFNHTWSTTRLTSESGYDVKQSVGVPLAIALILGFAVVIVVMYTKVRRRQLAQQRGANTLGTVSGGVPMGVAAYRNYGIHLSNSASTIQGSTSGSVIAIPEYTELPPSYEDAIKDVPFTSTPNISVHHGFPAGREAILPPYSASEGNQTPSTGQDNVVSRGNHETAASRDNPEIAASRDNPETTRSRDNQQTAATGNNHETATSGAREATLAPRDNSETMTCTADQETIAHEANPATVSRDSSPETRTSRTPEANIASRTDQS